MDDNEHEEPRRVTIETGHDGMADDMRHDGEEAGLDGDSVHAVIQDDEEAYDDSFHDDIDDADEDESGDDEAEAGDSSHEGETRGRESQGRAQGRQQRQRGQGERQQGGRGRADGQRGEPRGNPHIDARPGTVYRIKLSHSSESFLVKHEQSALEPGSLVVVSTKYGRDIGTVAGRVDKQAAWGREEFLPLDRVATADDIARKQANAEKERQASRICKEKIDDHKLEMKLVTAHYVLDEQKVVFFFTAENRVDFRELVKDLVGIFKIRIELRQIGVRDEARVLGGMGVCGKVFCCHGITDKMNAVSIKMAKDQNLSLNSMKISGPCGRLLCCLSYEAAMYRDERRSLPSEGVKINWDNTLFRVTEINVIKGLVRLNGEDGRVVRLPSRRFKRNDEGRWGILDEAPEDKGS